MSTQKEISPSEKALPPCPVCKIYFLIFIIISHCLDRILSIIFASFNEFNTYLAVTESEKIEPDQPHIREV